MASVNVHCPRCNSAQVYRHGALVHGWLNGYHPRLLILKYVNDAP
ncbi:IS1 family transposase [Enterobacter sp. BIDMC 29]